MQSAWKASPGGVPADGAGLVITEAIRGFGTRGLPASCRAQVWQACSGARQRRLEAGAGFYPQTVVLLRQVQALTEALILARKEANSPQIESSSEAPETSHHSAQIAIERAESLARNLVQSAERAGIRGASMSGFREAATLAAEGLGEAREGLAVTPFNAD